MTETSIVIILILFAIFESNVFIYFKLKQILEKLKERCGDVE